MHMYLHYASSSGSGSVGVGGWGVVYLEVDSQFAAIGQAIFVCGCPDAPVTTES